MLRPLKSPTLANRIIAFRGTNDGSDSFDSQFGSGDITFTYNNVGKTIAAIRNPFQRGSVVVAGIGTDVADGGYVALDNASTATSKTAFQLNSLGTAGSADAGTVYGLCLGSDSLFTDTTGSMGNNVVATSARPRILLFRCTASAIVQGTRDGTFVDNGTGDFTINFRTAFGSANVIAIPTIINATGGSALIESVSAASVRVKTFNTSNAAADLPFMLAVVGWGTLSESYNKRAEILSTQRKARLMGFNITGTGTAALTYDGGGSLTDNGTGDYTITFDKAFKRTPIVVATGNLARAAIQAVPSTSAVRILTFNAAHSAADALVSVLVIGYDSTDET